MESLPADTKKYYAITRWSVADIKELKPNWNRKRCEDFLQRHADKITDVMVQAGWWYIENELEEEEENGNKTK